MTDTKQITVTIDQLVEFATQAKLECDCLGRGGSDSVEQLIFDHFGIEVPKKPPAPRAPHRGPFTKQEAACFAQILDDCGEIMTVPIFKLRP